MTAASEPRFLVVGHLSKAHGTRGELFVQPLTDHPHLTFVSGVRFHLGKAGDGEPDHELPSLTVEEARPYKRGFLVRFEQIEDRTRAEAFRGRYLFRPLEDAAPLEEGEIFYHQLLGMEVVTVGGEAVGTVVEVYELHPAHMLEVRGAEKSHLVPFMAGVVEELDVEGRRIVIDPPEGLLEL